MGNKAYAIVVETIIVPVNGGAVNSTTILNSGSEYMLTASGTFSIGASGDGLADAEYADFSNPPASLIDVTAVGNIDIGISIDGNLPDWGAYASDHIYTILFSGADSAINIRYLDSSYGDNNTSDLTLTISSPVPLPAAAWLLGSSLIALTWSTRRKTPTLRNLDI